MLLVGLGGCSSHQPLSVHISDGRLTEQSEKAAVVEFTLTAANPNDFELPVRSVEYALAVDGKQVFSTSRAGLMSVPRKGEVSLRIPAVIPLEEAGIEPGEHGYTLSGRVFYSLPGKLADVLYDAKLSRPNVSISDTGTIELP